jgi:VanZ family protein
MFRIIIFLRPVAMYLMAAWWLIIMVFSSIPYVPTLKLHTARADFRLDYLFHFCQYGLLAFLTLLSFAGEEFRVGFRKAAILIPALMLMAFLDELHQKLIPGRTYSINDMLSNMTGIFAAALFTYIVFRIIRKRSNKTK